MAIAMPSAVNMVVQTTRSRTTDAKTTAVAAEERFDVGRLTSSPEYLIRRAHKLAVAGFAEACVNLGVTPSQYTAMFMLRGRAPVGQNQLGRLVALDRSTMSLVVRSLRERHWVRITDDANDKRKTLLALTDEGRRVLAAAEQFSTRAGEQLLSVFDKQHSALFMSMLQQLVSANDGESAGHRP